MKKRLTLFSLCLFFHSFIQTSYADDPGLGGYAVVNSDGTVCGVIVANSSDPFGNGGTMPVEYMGCPAGSRIVFQTKPSPDGNVAGYGAGGGTKYDSNTQIFTVSNSGNSDNTQPVLVIKDGVATDSSGNSFDTGSGAKTVTTLTPKELVDFLIVGNRVPSQILDNFNSESLGKALTEANAKLTANVKALVQEAIQKAITAARNTPNLERCINWSGYGNSGKECRTFSSDTLTAVSTSSTQSLDTLTAGSEISPSGVVSSGSINSQSDSTTPKVSRESTLESLNSTVEKLQVKSTITTESVSIKSTIKEIKPLVNAIVESSSIQKQMSAAIDKLGALREVTYSRNVKLPNYSLVDESAISLTPSICVVQGLTITGIGKGSCSVEYHMKDSNGNIFTIEKKINFKS